MITYLTLKKSNITDFSKARNKLLKNTKTSWVFFVDSDERLSQALIKELHQLQLKAYSGFYVIRINYFIGQCVGIDKIIRLGKIGKGRWKRKVHERWKISGNIGQLKNPIIHYTANTVYQYVDKINFYSDLHSNENKKEGKSSNIFKVILFPIFKLIETFIKSRHVVFSIMQSFHSFLSWSKQYLKEKN